MVVFHEREIRKKLGAFSKLGEASRESFLKTLSDLIARADFSLIPIVIDKLAIRNLDMDPIHAYHLSMRLGLEKLYTFLQVKEQHIGQTHIVFEARGRTEDCALELECNQVCGGSNSLRQRLPFEIVIAGEASPRLKI